MTKKEKNISLSYKISKIHTLKFSFEEIDNDRAEYLFETPNALFLHTNVVLNIDKEKSTIAIDINSNLSDKEKKEVLVEHSGRTIFHFKGLNDVYNEKEDIFDIPDGILVQLFSLSYSHARALLAMEVSPTIFKDHYILPVIDPTEFLKKK